jgi:anti-anti-sigma factor
MPSKRDPIVSYSVVDGRAVIKGEIDLRSSAHISAWLATFEEGPLDVDLGEVTFFDSTALRTMITARRRNPGARIVNPSGAVRRVLEVTSTSEYLMNGEEEDTAPPRP